MSEPTARPDTPRRVRKRVMALHRSGDRPEAEYAALRAELDAVAAAERNLPWRQADILLDVHFRLNSRRVIRRLARVRRTCDNRGEPDRYERLWAKVQQLLGELTLSTHGYSPRLALRSPGDLWPQVGTVLDRLGAAGYPAFVNSGTLLGLVRGDGVIAHDDDVDLAVVLHADDADAAAYEWLELRRRLREDGLLDIEFDERALVHTKAASPDGLLIDLFPGWIGDGRLYLWPYSFGDVAVEDVLPLTAVAVDENSDLPGPARPEALLSANYGDDWRTPDPLFAFDWASAKERFSHFRDLVKNGYVAQ
ncbi:hypothetical protein [Solicola gregarius]|uniref:LicD family protein n=1 Tax=Solicola gregarius TaxID=2908642 RepID=A0AA46TJU7_9ACTN|nr:hypothetical protein [Solicola gregarius]UYM06606.1 hypothetical protein L0C25_05920 [Solicola gregarius]